MKRLKPLLLPAAAIVLAAVLNTFFLANVHVPSASMEPAIPSGAMVLADRTAYRTEAPKAGDIVVFSHGEAGACRLIKRIVAVPGQVFSIRDGRVYIDGLLLPEEYIQDFSSDDYPETLVPEGCYLVLGDNRNHSSDSRKASLGTVDVRYVIGRAVFLAFPGPTGGEGGPRELNRIGVIA